MVCSPDISMSYSVFTRTHEKKQIRESLRKELLLRGNNDFWRKINLGLWELKLSNLWPNAFVKVWKRIISLKQRQSKKNWEAASVSLADTAHPFRLNPWLLELDSGTIQPSHPLSSLSPPACNPSQYQDLFKWVCFLHKVAKWLEFQLQHKSFQWIFRTDLL